MKNLKHVIIVNLIVVLLILSTIVCVFITTQIIAGEKKDSQPLQLAITFDDLPWAGPLPPGDTASQAIRRITAILRVHDVPATGFVINDKAQLNIDAVQTWVDWGNTLGNHSASHPDINHTAIDDWISDVERCHKFLQQFGDAYKPYFRYPMLHQGNTLEKRTLAKLALHKMDLHTAHVTVDNSEWILTQIHAATLENNDDSLRYAVGQEFISHILEALKHADAVARRKTGDSVPQILLLHANTLVEDHLDALLIELIRYGVEFISLEEALSDPVYKKEDEYIGSKGLSWLYRMKPLSVKDVQWDDNQAARIQEKFAWISALDDSTSHPASYSYRYISDAAPQTLMRTFDDAENSERMRSLLIMHRGALVAEGYFNGAGPETLMNLKSVTKSLTSALVGVALRQGWIQSVNDSIGQYLPTRIEPKSNYSNITIHELLTMSSGLQPVDYGKIQQSPDWVDLLISQPIRDEYRGKFVYDTPVFQLLSAVLENASGLSVDQIAREYLLKQLDAEIIYWRTDPQGYELGGNDAYLRSRDLIKLGELYRLDGVYKNSHILPEEYVKASISNQISPEMDRVNHNTLTVRGYGYLWWLLEIRGEPFYAALGHGGQILIISEERELVILLTSRWPSYSSSEHYRHLTKILVDGILPNF